MARVTTVVIGLTLALIPASAGAATTPAFLPAVNHTLTSRTTTDRVCHASSAPGRGIAHATYRAPMTGFVTIRAIGRTGGNWDLAAFDSSTHKAVTTSEGFRSDEVAQAWVSSGQRLLIQGCHESGRDATFPLEIVFADATPPADVRPSLVRVPTENPSVLGRLENMGFDVTENVRDGHADVVVPSPAKLDLLRKTGLPFTIRSLDMRKDFAAARRADARYTAATAASGGSPLPSHRTNYRTYADVQTELAQLVKDHPGLVRPVVLGHSFQGREIQGVEIAKNVDAPNDGRPTFLLVAMHHAREWPSVEAAMEYAHMLVDGYGSDQELTDLATNERTVIVPVINPDGYIASRGTSPDPADTIMNTTGVNTPVEGLDTIEGVFVPFGGNLAYRRKNCDGPFPNAPGHQEQNLPCYYQWGVDPNRNYGENWGGVGASSDPNTQSYRGAGQWSEPETQAVWHWSQVHNVTFMLTLHNVAALVLRPPGVHTDGLAPDEQRMKELGDQMAADTGYTSEYGWQLYDTSGTTEDWQYGAQAAFGYTIEMGPPGGKFHDAYQTSVVDQWTGKPGSPQAGAGLRKALITAAESAANPGDHSVIQGSAPAGYTLHLHKQFDTKSSPICTYAQGIFVAGSILSPLDCVSPGSTTTTPDHLDYTMVVPPSGAYRWDVTPSTRPFVWQHVTPGGYSTTAFHSDTYTATDADIHPDRAVDDQVLAALGLSPDNEADYAATRQFNVPDGEAGERLVVDLSWGTSAGPLDLPPQDYDLKLYHLGSDGKLSPAGTGTAPGVGGSSGSSGNSNGVPEQITVDNAASGDYVARIIYYMTGADKAKQANDWTLKVSRFRHDPDTVTHGQELWTMTCETGDKQVLESKDLYVERGQAVTADFTCGRAPGNSGDHGPGNLPPQAQGNPPGRGGVKGERQGSAPKKPSRRATCLKKARRVHGKARRHEAVARCYRRYRRAR